MRPSDWLSYADLGYFYFGRQRYQDAEPLFRKLIALTPDNHLGYRNLGAVILSEGRYEEAAQMMQRSIAVKPSAAAYSNLAVLFMYQDRYDEAVAPLEKAIAIGGANYANDYKIWANLGDACRWSRGHAKRAPEAYRKAAQLAGRQLAVNPNDATVRSSLAVYWAKLGEHAKAASEMAAAISLAPADTTVVFKSALVHELAGRREEALAALRRAVQARYSKEEINRDPYLTNLRKDARYHRLMAETPTGRATP